MSNFFCKLLPPRPTFPMDMTETEGAIMQEHFVYWTDLMAKAKVVAYGPVMDPKGTYGIAILEVDDETTAQNIMKNDPAIKSDAGFSFEVHQMPDALVRPVNQ